VITWSDVTAIAPELSDVSAQGQAAILAHVALQVGETEWGDYAAMGQAYLAAHLGALALSSAGAGGAVQSESVGTVSVTYAVNAAVLGAGLDSTTWGREYSRVRALLPCTFGLVVL